MDIDIPANWPTDMAGAIAIQAHRNIIVTLNLLTFVAFPIKETAQSLYFRSLTRSPQG